MICAATAETWPGETPRALAIASRGRPSSSNLMISSRCLSFILGGTYFPHPEGQRRRVICSEAESPLTSSVFVFSEYRTTLHTVKQAATASRGPAAHRPARWSIAQFSRRVEVRERAPIRHRSEGRKAPGQFLWRSNALLGVSCKAVAMPQ